MAQKNCRNLQPPEQGARALQTDDRRTGDSKFTFAKNEQQQIDRKKHEKQINYKNCVQNNPKVQNENRKAEYVYNDYTNLQEYEY